MKDQAYYDGVIAELIKQSRHNLRAFDFPGEVVPDEFRPDRAKGVPAPSLEKPIPGDAETIELLDRGHLAGPDAVDRCSQESPKPAYLFG